MSTIQINGTDFLTGDRVFLRFTSSQGGIIDLGNFAVYNPAGPNAGSNDVGFTTTQWTDTLIEVDLNAAAAGVVGGFLRDVLLEDFPNTYQVPFDLIPDIEVPPVVPLIEDYSYVDFYDTITNAPGWTNPGCTSLATQNSVPGIFFYTQNFVTGGGDGVRLTVDGLPVDYLYSLDPQFFGGPLDDGYFLFADPALAGSSITAAQPLDINGDPVGGPTALQLNYNTASDAGIQTGDPDVLEIQWSYCPTTPTRLSVYRCTPNNVQDYYDPLGPNAGLNPVGATIIQWDTTAIIVDHPAYIGVGPIHRIETRDQYGRTMFVIGNPIPSI